MLSLCCFAGAFSGCGEQRLLFVGCVGVSLRCLPVLQSPGSRCVVFSGCSSQALECGLCNCGTSAKACGIFLKRGWNPCPPHWQDSYPFRHQWGPLQSFTASRMMHLPQLRNQFHLAYFPPLLFHSRVNGLNPYTVFIWLGFWLPQWFSRRRICL